MKFLILVFIPQLLFATPSEPKLESLGSCFEINGGSEVLGSVLQIKKFENNIHTTISFTLLPQSSSHRFQILKSESDEHFLPLRSNYELYENGKLVKSRFTTFENKKDTVSIKTKDLNSKKPLDLEEPKGLVLSQHMFDLLFDRKKITEIAPQEKLVFQTFSETEGKLQQVTSQLEAQTDHLSLTHKIEGNVFKTSHASDGKLISNHDLTKNIKLKPCSASSVLKYMNSALSYKKFNSLFSFEDREKIKKCCQHF